MRDHDPEMDAILELLEKAGLVEVYVNADGKQAMRLTSDGERLARQVTMSEDSDAVLDALLEAQAETYEGQGAHRAHRHVPHHPAQAAFYGSRSPSRDTADLLGIKPVKVREELRAARRAGLLPVPGQGRSGGEMTPKGNAVLMDMIDQRLGYLDQAFEAIGRARDLPFDGTSGT